VTSWGTTCDSFPEGPDGAPSAVLTDESHLEVPEPLPGRRFAVVVARFNREITETLERRCVETLIEGGVSEDDIDVVRVPGSWELPQTVGRVVRLNTHDGIVALGCVIRGETAHFDFVAGEASRGLGAIARLSDIPIIFGVLTPDNEEQAWERAGVDRGDRGREFALSALHMVALFGELE